MSRLIQVPQRLGSLSGTDRLLYEALTRLVTGVNGAYTAPSQKGQQVSSNTTITLTDPITVVTGTGAILTINQPEFFCPALLIATDGFSLGTSGNILSSVIVRPGGMVLLYFDFSILKWYAASVQNTNPNVIFTQTVDSDTVANNLSTMLGTGIGSATVPPNSLVLGRRLTVRAMGFCSVTDGGANAKTVSLLLNATTIATGVSAAYTNIINDPWAMDAELFCRSIGTAGTASGYVRVFNIVGNVAGVSSAGPVTIDTTIPLTIDVRYNNGNAVGVIRTISAVIKTEA